MRTRRRPPSTKRVGSRERRYRVGQRCRSEAHPGGSSGELVDLVVADVQASARVDAELSERLQQPVRSRLGGGMHDPVEVAGDADLLQEAVKREVPVRDDREL